MSTFRIDVEDTTGTPVASLKNFQYFSCDLRVARRGSFRLQLHYNDPNASLIEPDYIIRYWYKNPQYNIDWTNVFNGIIKTPSTDWYSNGNKLSIFYGSDSNEMFDKASVLYPTSSSKANKTMIASDAMKEYLEENITSLATTTNDRYVDHVNPVTIVYPSTGVGDVWSGNMANDSLTKALQDVRNFTHDQENRVDFQGYYLGNYEWEIQVGKIYEDKTTNGLDNTTGKNGAGNVPVILSPLYKNVKSYTESIPRVQESNVVVGLGQRQGEDRDTYVAIDETSRNFSPISQRESVAQSQNQDNIQDFVDAELQNRVGKITLLVDPKFTPSFSLFKDLNIGDFFTVVSLDNLSVNKQMVELSIVVQQTFGGRTIDTYQLALEDREF